MNKIATTYILVGFLLLLSSSCSKPVKEANTEKNIYQKELSYNGLKGKIDSVVVTSYLLLEDSSRIMIEKEISIFDQAGYISDKVKINYQNNEEVRSEKLSYVRDNNNLKTSFTRKARNPQQELQNTTVLKVREESRETWEASAIVNGNKIDTKSSSSYHYTNNTLVYLTENKSNHHHHEHGEDCNHETTLVPVYEISYNQMGLPHDVKFFGLNMVVTTFYEYYYNEDGFLTKTTARYAKVSTGILDEEVIVESEAIRFVADEHKNPKEVVTLFRNGQQQVSEYNIYYRK